MSTEQTKGNVFTHFILLKLTSHSRLHYFWSADLSKSFSHYVNIYFFSINSFCQFFSFLNIFFNRFCQVKKCGVTPHCLYSDSLTLTTNRVLHKCTTSLITYSCCLGAQATGGTQNNALFDFDIHRPHYVCLE